MAKYKITIGSVSFEADIEKVEEAGVVVPIEEELTPTSPKVEVISINFDEMLTGGESVRYLPSSFYNKEIILDGSVGKVKPTIKALVGGNTIFRFKDWKSSPTQLIDLSETEELGTVGCTFTFPKPFPSKILTAEGQLFGWERDTVKKGKFAYINGQEIADKDIITYGLCRFGYSSDSESDILLIAKNIHHNGYNFTQIKNPYRGNLYLALLNCSIYNPVTQKPQSSKYTPSAVKVTIQVQDGVATIISDNTFDQILTWEGYNKGNQRSILYFDRYVYDISELMLIDNKRLKIRRDSSLEKINDTSFRSSGEYQPLDKIRGFGTIIQKQIDESRRANWIYTHDNDKSLTTEILSNEINGTFEAFIIYKGNALFNNGHLNKDTKFGEQEILSSQGVGWSWYNQEFSGYIENFNKNYIKDPSMSEDDFRELFGYYRNSGDGNPTQGLTIINSQFGINPPTATSTNPLKKEVSEYIKYLEAL